MVTDWNISDRIGVVSYRRDQTAPVKKRRWEAEKGGLNLGTEASKLKTIVNSGYAKGP